MGYLRDCMDMIKHISQFKGMSHIRMETMTEGKQYRWGIVTYITILDLYIHIDMEHIRVVWRQKSPFMITTYYAMQKE
jgi:hypothetical protein